jgi:putative DNA primase/helicase
MAKEGIVYSGPIEADGRLHRFEVEGDPRGKRNGFFTLHLDERPAGIFGCCRRYGNDHKFHWTGKGATKLTPDERAKLAHKSAGARERRLVEVADREAHAAVRAKTLWDSAKETDNHPYLTRKGVKGYGLRVGQWVKERRDGSTYVAAENALLIPIKNGSGLVSLQAIFANPVGDEQRDKDFIYGGKKLGCWSTIGRPTELEGRVTVLICEGYATGASIHEATGFAVVVAFDAGNLGHVARAVRRRMPSARILIAGDNDQFTDQPIKNPGLTRARDAAAAVEGEWVVPVFSDLEVEPTDFNDLHALEGLGAVRSQIMAVLGPAAPQFESPPKMPEGREEPDRVPSEPPSASLSDRLSTLAIREGAGDEDNRENPHFSILGFDRDAIFIYQHEMKMIVRRGLSEWSESALTALAPLQWWEIQFPSKSGMSRKLAINWLQRMAYKRGVFDPNFCRGRGAWRDGERVVFHFGHKLWVDGDIIDVEKADSAYVYEQGKRLHLPADVPMSSEEGGRLVETAQMFSWSRPASAVLLAGWMAIAPLGGALRWRPHIWLTGAAGSGKSTILNEFLHRLVPACVYAQGNSTEAGIRQTLRSDSLPVLFDETEQNNEKEALRVQSILALIRQSSTQSEARTLKGTQGGSAMDFVIRSMFCLSSIQVGMKHQADMERVTVLSLRSKKEGKTQTEKAAAAENWQRISAAIAWLRDPDVAPRLLRRSLDLLPTTIQNIERFAQAAAERFGSQRDGDQYGALLAGAWSLLSNKVATIDDARAMIGRYDWSEYLENSETEESEKALNALLGRLLRVKNGQEISLYELIARVAGQNGDLENMSPREAYGALVRYGVRVDRLEDGRFEVRVANSHAELSRLMQDTPYAADLRGQLLRVPGATKSNDKQRFNASPIGYVRLPLDQVL